jgi:AraC-like DNA-binding protein
VENYKSIFLLLAALQGIFLSIALITVHFKKQPANIFMAIVLIVCSIELLNAWAMTFGYHSQKKVFPFWIIGSYWLIPPSLFLFFLLNLSLKPAFKPMLLFIPALIEILTEFFFFYLRHSEEFSMVLQGVWWMIFTEILPVIGMILVLVWCGIKLRNMSLPVHNNNLHFKKQYGFFILFVLLTLLWTADTLFTFNVYSTIEVVLCISLFGLGYVVYFRPDFFEPPISIKSRQAEELFMDYDDAEAMQRLLQLFEIEKIYLKPRLTLENVANTLKLPERYVSLLIHKYHQTNFSHFVNTYRVREVLIQIENPAEKHKTILGIALDAGFSSKSSFNQIFKTITGKPPSHYLRKTDK